MFRTAIVKPENNSIELNYELNFVYKVVLLFRECYRFTIMTGPTENVPNVRRRTRIRRTERIPFLVSVNEPRVLMAGRERGGSKINNGPLNRTTTVSLANFIRFGIMCVQQHGDVMPRVQLLLINRNAV